MRRSLPILLLLLAPALWCPPAAAFDVDVLFQGDFDLASYETWAWRLGVPAAGEVVERILRETLEAQLAAEGLTLVAGEADCYVSTDVIRDNKFPAGVLKVNIMDAETEQPAWQGILYGVLNTGKEKKIRKVFRRAFAEMFEEFPFERAAEDAGS